MAAARYSNLCVTCIMRVMCVRLGAVLNAAHNRTTTQNTENTEHGPQCIQHTYNHIYIIYTHTHTHTHT